MMLNIIWGVLITFLALVLIVLLLLILVHLSLFHCHRCPDCNHIMEYKGLRDDDEGGHFLFHCPKCRKWQQIKKAVFLRQ